MASREVTTGGELLDALKDGAAVSVEVAAAIGDLPSLTLQPGQAIRGRNRSVELSFAPGVDGVRLSRDNAVIDIALIADPDRRALFNDTGVAGFGRIELTRLRVKGNVRLLATGEARGGHVEAHDIDILEADARAFPERPSGFGVEVVPGVFTIWNMQSDPDSRVTGVVSGVSAGRTGAPVRGSGVFVGGTPGGGRLVLRRLDTGELHVDGGIARDTPDRISGGVFAVHGAWVDEVRNRGPVTTYGANDMVLDNWGTVGRWRADGRLTSHGPSGIGFVNFGDLAVLRVDGIIETFGIGARGFNVYAGTVGDAEFERIVTRADGAVGIQISQPVGRIAVRDGVETHGGVGSSLVEGKVMQLPATPFSIKPGGSAREVVIGGGLLSYGKGIDPLELHGRVERFTVSGSLGPAGPGFDPI